jgi:nicotinate-nucleotide pyrophosphorylase
MEELRELVARALAEDLGGGDLTSDAVVPAGAQAKARIVQKRPGVVFGLDLAAEAFAQAGATEFAPCSPPSARRSTSSVISRASPP